MTWTVPLTDVVVGEEDVEAVMACLRGGWLTMGPRIQAFEQAFAEQVAGPSAVAVSSGTAALHLALRAAGVGPGDEVIVPALTFVASAAAVAHAGAQPVLCDIGGPGDLNLDVEQVERRISERTKAVIAVHFMGYGADVASLRALCDSRGLLLVEDAAQAIGADVLAGRSSQEYVKAGTAGDVGCFSFFSKQQLCTGEGGMLVSADEQIIARARSLRSHAMTSGTWDRHRGHAETYDVVDIGFNFRMDEPRAALALSRLPRLQAEIAARRRIARAYREALAECPGVEVPFDDDAVARGSHFAFVVLAEDRARRDQLRAALRERGIQTTFYPALTELSAYAGHERQPRSEDVAARHVVLPLWAGLSESDQQSVVGGLFDALGSSR